jgi:hypothetical protein
MPRYHSDIVTLRTWALQSDAKVEHWLILSVVTVTGQLLTCIGLRNCAPVPVVNSIGST